jgi:hypothetical protein
MTRQCCLSFWKDYLTTVFIVLHVWCIKTCTPIKINIYAKTGNFFYRVPFYPRRNYSPQSEFRRRRASRIGMLRSPGQKANFKSPSDTETGNSYQAEQKDALLVLPSQNPMWIIRDADYSRWVTEKSAVYWL